MKVISCAWKPYNTSKDLFVNYGSTNLPFAEVPGLVGNNRIVLAGDPRNFDEVWMRAYLPLPAAWQGYLLFHNSALQHFGHERVELAKRCYYAYREHIK